MAYAIGRMQHRDVEIGINDNGFYLASEKPIQALRAFKLLKKWGIKTSNGNSY